MADKLLIVMANADPDKPAVLAAPFLQATIAATMEYDVEMVFTGLSGRLAVRGVAERVFIKPDGQKSAYDLIRDAHAAGVRFKICTSAVELWGSDLIPEIEETVGSAYIVSEAMDDGTVTFTY